MSTRKQLRNIFQILLATCILTNEDQFVFVEKLEERLRETSV